MTRERVKAELVALKELGEARAAVVLRNFNTAAVRETLDEAENTAIRTSEVVDMLMELADMMDDKR